MAKQQDGRSAKRAPRVKLGGTVLALMRLENGRNIRARLHQLSITGGLMHVENPLDEGIKVEVLFHVGKSTVRSKARLLFPMWATQGYLQPFKFEDLQEQGDELQTDLQNLLTKSAAAGAGQSSVVSDANNSGIPADIESASTAPDSFSE